MKLSHAVVVAVAAGCGWAVSHPVMSQPVISLAEAAAKRFPQSVSVGSLVGRTVLEPVESQVTLGHVDRVVRSADGQIKVVVQYGGVLGFGARAIAVPLDAMTLLGPYMEIVDFKPAQLRDFPSVDGRGGTVLPDGEVVRVGLSRPSH